MIVFLMVYVSFMAALLYSCIFAFMLQSHLAYLNNLNEVKLKRLKSNDPNVSIQDTNLRLPISINQSESFALEERIIDKAENSASIKISPVKSQLTSYESSLPISELLSREVNTITVCGSKIKNIYLISVLPPIIIFIICLFLDLIDASPIHGVCFITNKKLRNKITNVFVPILLCFIIKFFFFIRAICFINVLRKICQTSTHDSDKTFAVKLAQTGFTLVVFLLTLVVILVVGISVELYNYFNKDVWEKSLEDYLLCELNKTLRTCPQSSEPCRMLQKPGIRLLLLQVSMYFALMFCYWTMLYKHSKSVTGSSIKQLIIRWNNRFTSDTSNKEANSFLSCEVPFSSWWDLGLFHSTHEKASSKLKENDFHLSGKGKKNEENLSKSSTSSLFQQGAREESETWRNSYHSELVSLGDSHLTVNSTNSMCMASTPGGTAPRQKRFENRRTRRRADRRKQRDRLSRAVSIVSCRSNSFGPNKSKTSLKSARSYNSYELVGGCWCETIRTRNVLINALRWANMMTPKLPHPNCTAGFSPPTQCQCTGCQPAPLPPAPVNNQSLVCHQPPQQMMPTSPLTLKKKPSAPERRDSDEYDSEDETVSILDFKQDDQNRIVSNGSGLEVPDNDSDSFCSDDEANSEYELKHGKDIEMLGDSNSRVAPQHKDI